MEWHTIIDAIHAFLFVAYDDSDASYIIHMVWCLMVACYVQAQNREYIK